MTQVQGKISFCLGEVVHLYDGTRGNRKYVDRVKCLTDYCFDLSKHVRVAENGLWSFTEAEYFQERLEDK